MKCGTCGAELKEGAVFCETCGARQKTSKEVKAQEFKRGCGKSTYGLGAILFAFCSIIFVAFAEIDRHPGMLIPLLLFVGMTGVCIYQYRKY